MGASAAADDLRTMVHAAVERVLGRSVAPDVVLMAAGLDSLGSEELLAELGKFARIDTPAHAFFLEHPSIDALVLFLEGRTLARRARAFTLLGWCSATASWAACLAGHHRLRWWVLALACATLMAWQRGLLRRRRSGEPSPSGAGGDAGPTPVSLLSSALPAAALVAFTAWPTLFFVVSSLAFVFAGALPKGWLTQATGLAAGVFRDAPHPRGSSLRGGAATAPAASPVPSSPAKRAQPRAPAAGSAQEPSAPPPAESALQKIATPRAAAVIAAAAAPGACSPRAAEYDAQLANLRAGLGPEIAIEQLERGRTVGLGSYGKVMLVRHAQSGTPYALKCLNRRLVVANGQQRAVARERAVMACVSHPFCARLVRTFKDAHAVYLLLEWCPGGELLRHLPRTPGVGLPEPAACFYVACVALALEHLHAHGVVYRDIKPENCLLDAEGYLKICDFGFAKRLGAGAEGVTYTVCGTPDFMAPEVIRGVGHGRAADLWSLGVLVYELVTGRPPFCDRGAQPAAIYAAVLAGAAPPVLPTMTPDMQALVTALLVPEPATRLGAGSWADVKAHAWFSALVWNALECRQVAAPIVPKLSGLLDTRHFDAFPDNAVALNDARDNDDEEGAAGGGSRAGRHSAGGACGELGDEADEGEHQQFAPEELFGAWDRSF